MIPARPLANLPTHDVENMPPYIGDQDLWSNDQALHEGIEREGAGWAQERLSEFGRDTGSAETFKKADLANRYPPELRAFDRYGMRINQVDYHPAYHELMALAIENDVPSFAWKNPRSGGQVAHAALTYLFTQAEGGVLCPMAMTYAAIPALRMTPVIGDEWIPRLLVEKYDPRDIPVHQKTGATMGMFMTEKQGGSDVRANSTRAIPVGVVDDGLSGGRVHRCPAPEGHAPAPRSRATRRIPGPAQAGSRHRNMPGHLPVQAGRMILHRPTRHPPVHRPLSN